MDYAKQRQRMGNAVFTEETVRAIRRLGTTHSARELAQVYGCGVETVRRVLRRETWGWLPDEAPVAQKSVVDIEADAVLRRVLAATGMQHLQQAAAQHFRADALVDELAAGKPVNPLDE